MYQGSTRKVQARAPHSTNDIPDPLGLSLGLSVSSRYQSPLQYIPLLCRLMEVTRSLLTVSFVTCGVLCLCLPGLRAFHSSGGVSRSYTYACCVHGTSSDKSVPYFDIREVQYGNHCTIKSGHPPPVTGWFITSQTLCDRHARIVRIGAVEATHAIGDKNNSFDTQRMLAHGVRATQTTA